MYNCHPAYEFTKLNKPRNPSLPKSRIETDGSKSASTPRFIRNFDKGDITITPIIKQRNRSVLYER